MNIQLSKKLKSLRQTQGISQEQLANYLNISSQAVSKWERDDGFPDITLLPKIAGYYHITVDQLLGVDEIARQERIDAITSEYNQLRHHVPLDLNYKLDEGIELIRNALKQVPGDFFFEQLLASDLSWKGKNTSDETVKLLLLEEAIMLCEDIRARSTEDRWRDCASQILLVMYADLGMTEKALDLAYQMPTPRCTCEYMLTYILKDEALLNRHKINAVIFYQLFRGCISKMHLGGMSIEDMLDKKELSIAAIGVEEYSQAIKNII